VSFDVKLSITGIQKLQAANNRRLAALKPTGAPGRALKWGTAHLHRVLVANTHVDTGALRASRRMEIVDASSRLFTDPGAINPRDGKRTAFYDEFEEARGGSHAAWRNTYTSQAPYVVTRMSAMIAEALE
jgi:hypothetical protein